MVPPVAVRSDYRQYMSFSRNSADLQLSGSHLLHDIARLCVEDPEQSLI